MEGKHLVACLGLIFLIVPLVSAQSDLLLDIEGDCVYYNVTVSDLEEACYNIKIDVTNENGRVGEVYDPREGWKSSYYYVNEVCVASGGEIKVHVRASEDSILNFRGTLKSGSSEWQSEYYEIVQNCPKTSAENYPIEYFLLPVLLSTVVVFAVIVLYVKKWKK
ncbi:MAG: hypothetical protein KKB03_00405 [Nanoarchaeota archaeon]|nr:hypothetical protein [Nanoarchaeota archaeon]MBU1135448.1 hypothetical protein [Nanoarchaeota archaeon]MBU2519690.1 hypothetical protein [Nanoarchaeota archaeon]